MAGDSGCDVGGGCDDTSGAGRGVARGETRAGADREPRVLGAVLLPTAGRVKIDGLDLGTEPHEVRKRIGFLPDVPPLYPEMTVGGYLDFVARLRGVPAAVAPQVAAASEAREANEADKRKRLAAGELGVDMYNMREPLAKAGLRYVD